MSKKSRARWRNLRREARRSRKLGRAISRWLREAPIFDVDRRVCYHYRQTYFGNKMPCAWPGCVDNVGPRVKMLPPLPVPRLSLFEAPISNLPVEIAEFESRETSAPGGSIRSFAWRQLQGPPWPPPMLGDGVPVIITKFLPPDAVRVIGDRVFAGSTAAVDRAIADLNAAKAIAA